MKRLGSSDSLGALMSICPSTEGQNPPNNHVCSREFQSTLDGIDEEGCLEDTGHVPEKKRRLSVDQVKALEKNFETENKLQPDRKVKLAQELGLQPRQVAVWFQNRRARWKTKQLERDYGALKANYDSLKLKLESLQNDNEALIKEIRKLKAKLNEENTESNLSDAETEALVSKSDNQATEPSTGAGTGAATAPVAMYFKDGPSESDSSAILNEDTSPNAAAAAASSNSSPPGGDSGFPTHNHHLLILSSSETVAEGFPGGGAQKGSSYETQFVKMEEHNYFSEETCNFFSEDQAPTLHWYSPETWT